jgi:glycosyltransferase XagB
VMLLWAALTLAATALVKLAALIQTLRAPPAEPANPAVIARLPTVSIMVALYKESDIAARLVRRLSRLDYPRALLDIMLIVEEDDRLTRDAVARADLPGWIRVMVAPRGRVKTKPRALNFGLAQCRGSIVGVYDAEDAPEPDQIRKVVDRFHQRGPQVACLQGRLDYYNPHRNWLSRCFTIEYAAWFRVVLPGMQRLGLALPLGGTTLFFRRDVLEDLGGWDSHNVTEDADLGMRLARHGYQTEVIDTTTHEEANCAALPWVRQRSRWVKGYMMTYLAHMRRPVLLWRQLGPRAFVGFQVLFLGSLTQSLLAPLMWSMLALQMGFGHPVAGVLNQGTIMAIVILFAAAEALNVFVGVIGLRRSGHDLSAAWVPTLILYFPLQALAAYKALWEVLTCPFYWDKTAHGAFSKDV